MRYAYGAMLAVQNQSPNLLSTERPPRIDDQNAHPPIAARTRPRDLAGQRRNGLKLTRERSDLEDLAWPPKPNPQVPHLELVPGH